MRIEGGGHSGFNELATRAREANLPVADGFRSPTAMNNTKQKNI
jgi:hypothetical protein